MKQVTIVVPEGEVNLACLTGAFEILTAANKYWQKMGKPADDGDMYCRFYDRVEIRCRVFFCPSRKYCGNKKKPI